MARKTLIWRGDEVTSKMRSAQIEGVNATMAACVVHAKRMHPWENQSGILEGAINIIDYARLAARGVRGVWGVQDAIQARILELGGVIEPVNAKALAIPQDDGGVVFVQSVTIPEMPYLRPAADGTYPALPMYIRRAYDRKAG